MSGFSNLELLLTEKLIEVLVFGLTGFCFLSCGLILIVWSLKSKVSVPSLDFEFAELACEAARTNKICLQQLPKISPKQQI